VDLYSALDGKYRPQGAQTWITQFNLQTTPCLPLAFVRIHKMDCGDDIKLQLTTYLSTPEWMKG